MNCILGVLVRQEQVRTSLASLRPSTDKNLNPSYMDRVELDTLQVGYILSSLLI